MNRTQILELMDQCVKCGQCLPVCPTYRKTLQESNSPRGRIAQAQGLLTGMVPDTPSLAESLDKCLECHACESMCPSKVQVTHIIDTVRTIRMHRRWLLTRWLRRKLLRLAVRPAMLMPYIRFYQYTWLRTWLQQTGLLRLLRMEYVERLLPTVPLTAIKTGMFPALNHCKGTIALFPGCLGRFIDTNALTAAVTILTRLSYNVYIPDQPCCCGALYRHDGFAEQADAELTNTIRLFAQYERILTVASACLESLRQVPELASKVEDATLFIATIPWPVEFNLDTIPETVWVHSPCTQRYPIGNPKSALTLLARIPGIIPQDLPENEVCCGSAGTYMLRQPALSQALLTDKLNIIQTTGATTVVTSNTGCLLQLAAGLREQKIRVCHPLEIMAERLQPNPTI